MKLPITTMYVLPLVAIWLTLWVRVVMARVATRTSIGDGGHTVMHEAVRRHGNFIEWVPFVLILMVLAEAQGASPVALNAAGLMLVAGRVVHPFGLSAANGNNILRKIANSLNMLSVFLLTFLLLRIALGL